jgi:hypothetical protein
MTKTTSREHVLRLAAATRAWAVHLRARAADERGEGVISMAIAMPNARSRYHGCGRMTTTIYASCHLRPD